MPKGRGANERRRSERQKHPSDTQASTARGMARLHALYGRWNDRRKLKVYR